MNKYKPKYHFNGDITLRAKDHNILYELAERYFALGYEIIKDRKGRELTPSFLGGSFRMKLSAPQGQLEMRLDGQKRGEHL